MLFHRQTSKNGKGLGQTVSDVESLDLRISGMQETEEYEILVNGDRAEISFYTVRYRDGHDERVLEKRSACGAPTVIDALNGFGFIGWNGFHGERPKGLLDGRMFTLTATLNGGQTLHADGAENFPRGFYEFESWLYNMLNDGEQ